MSFAIEDDQAAASASLSPSERVRASTFLHQPSRARFVAARVALRGILAAYVGAQPEELAVDIDPFGKPHVTGAPCFNVSHSADRAVVALAGSAVGVDIERAEERPGLLGIAQRFFADAEVAALRRLDRDAFTAAFYGCWTRKEALSKALGLGLGLALRSFEVSVPPEPARLIESVDGRLCAGAWTIRDLEAGPGFAGAVAARGEIETVIARNWPRDLQDDDRRG